MYANIIYHELFVGVVRYRGVVRDGDAEGRSDRGGS